MCSCTTTSPSSAPPRHSRTPRPPPPRTGLRSQRRERSARRGASRGAERRRIGEAGRAQGGAQRGRVAHPLERLGRAPEQSPAGGQPGDEPRLVLESRAVDHARRRDPLRRVHQRRHPAASAEVAQHGHARAKPPQVEVPEMVERHDVVPGSHPQLGEHARADGDQQDRLADGGPHGRRPSGQSTPSSSATNSTAVTRSAVVPGLRALPSWRSEASNPASAVRPRALRTPPAVSTSPGGRRHATGRVGAALAGDQRVRDGGEEAQRRLDDGVARAQPITQRIGEGGQPELERHRMVGDVLACDRVALRGRRHGLAQGHAGLVAHVVLDGLVEAAGARQADRRVGIARVVDGERAQHVAEALAERSTPKRRARERREQQRDAEVGVGAGDAARGAHRGQHRLADPALARAAELGTERDPAAQHVLVGGVVEVVARRDVARLLGARLQHAGQLRGADDLVGAETGDAARGARAPARRLLDRHSRHRISLAGGSDRGTQVAEMSPAASRAGGGSTGCGPWSRARAAASAPPSPRRSAARARRCS